jgi:outer membrane protein assembly factor BamB
MPDARLRRKQLPAIATAALVLLLGACDTVTLPGAGAGDVARAAELAFGAERVRWYTPDRVGGWTMRPEIAGPHVYFERDLELSRTGQVVNRAQLVALDRETGAVSWAQTMGTAGNAAVAGTVVAAVWGSLPMFDRATGAPLPVFRYGATSLSGNVVTDGARFYVTTHNGHALAVDPATGTADWDTGLAGPGTAVAFGSALHGELLAVTLKRFGSPAAPGDSGIVAVLDRATGAVRWRVAVSDGRDPGITDAPVDAGDLLVTRSGGHTVRAWDLRSGTPRWRFDGGGSGGVVYGGSGLAVCEGLVIAPTGDLGIVALDAATGTVRWKAGAADLGSLSSLECSHGTVLALGSRLAVYDARSGARRARFPIREPLDGERAFMIASVARDAEFLYVSTTYGWAKITAP